MDQVVESTWYRVGSKLKRTLYRCKGSDHVGELIGIMDSAEDAQLVCDALNYAQRFQLKFPGMWDNRG